jgi:hypothetical protein
MLQVLLGVVLDYILKCCLQEQWQEKGWPGIFQISECQAG